MCLWEIFVVQKKSGFNFVNCYVSVSLSIVLSQFDTTIRKTVFISVTYPEISWADRYTHQTQEGTTMVGAEWQIFKICLQMLWKCTSSLCRFLDFFVKHFPNHVSLHTKNSFRRWFFKKSFIQINLYGYKLVRAAKWSKLKRCSKVVQKKSYEAV